jgi:flagellar biosynthesis GTPase FlhF
VEAASSSRLFDDLVPAGATTVVEFADLLQQVRSRSGKTYDEVVRWVADNGGSTTLAKSTLSDLLNGQRLPRVGHLVAILLACGFAPDELGPWKQARARLEALPREHDLVVVRTDFDDFSRDLRDRLTEARQEVSDLRQREQDLAARLAREEIKCRQLEADLERLHALRSPAGEKNSPADEQRELELQALHEREREHIENMRTELVLINQARQRAEEQMELVAAESTDSQQTSRVVDLLELHFERAEYERRHREDLAGRLENAQLRVAELQRILAMYQGPAHSEQEAAPAPPPPPACDLPHVDSSRWWRRLFARSS